MSVADRRGAARRIRLRYGEGHAKHLSVAEMKRERDEKEAARAASKKKK